VLVPPSTSVSRIAAVIGTILVLVAVVFLVDAGGAGAAEGPCAYYVERSQQITEEDQKFTEGAYSDGKITTEELEESQRYADELHKVTEELGECIEGKRTPPPPPGAASELEKAKKEFCDHFQADTARIGELTKETDELSEQDAKVSRGIFVLAQVEEKVSNGLLVGDPLPEDKAVGLVLKFGAKLHEHLSDIGDLQELQIKSQAVAMARDYLKMAEELGAECPGYSVPPIQISPPIPATQLYTVLKHAAEDNPLDLRPALLLRKGGGNTSGRLKAATATVEAAGKKLKDALVVLAPEITPAGAPKTDLDTANAAQAAFAKAAKAALAIPFPAAALKLKIAAADLPKPLRNAPVGKAFVGKPLGRLIDYPRLRAAEAAWLSSSRTPLPLPAR
jgi:hypothetical protein